MDAWLHDVFFFRRMSEAIPQFCVTIEALLHNVATGNATLNHDGSCETEKLTHGECMVAGRHDECHTGLGPLAGQAWPACPAQSA